jgi:uncharacterized protein YegL
MKKNGKRQKIAVLISGLFFLIGLSAYSQGLAGPGEIAVDYYIVQVVYDDTPRSPGYQLITDSTIQVGNGYLQIGFQAPPEQHIKVPIPPLVSLRPSPFTVTTSGQDKPPALPVYPPPSSSKPKNLCFVIDISGSMHGKHLDLVKDMFRNIMKDIKKQDFISVVTFDDEANVLIEPLHIDTSQEREACLKKVDQLEAGKGTWIDKGMRLGYEVIESTYRTDYINRVLLLTDGDTQGDKNAILTIVKEKYTRQNITTISTIMLGSDASRDFMAQIADFGGGLSIAVENFAADDQLDSKSAIDWLISADKKELLQVTENAGYTRRSDLLMKDTTVSTTWRLNITLRLDAHIEVLDAWPADTITRNRVTYTVMLHNHVYKTMMLALNIKKVSADHAVFGRLTITGNDTQGNAYAREYSIAFDAKPGRRSITIPNTSGSVRRNVIIHNAYRDAEI